MWRGRWLSWLPGFCSLGPAQRSQYEEEEEEAAALAAAAVERACHLRWPVSPRTWGPPLHMAELSRQGGL